MSNDILTKQSQNVWYKIILNLYKTKNELKLYIKSEMYTKTAYRTKTLIKTKT